MTSEQILLYIILVLIGILYVRKTLRARGLTHYSAADAKQRAGSGSILLDVRTKAERMSRSIPSSIHIPLHELGPRINELDRYRHKEIICYCATGSRSVNAALTLKKAGFTVGNLDGGMSSWNFSER